MSAAIAPETEPAAPLGPPPPGRRWSWQRFGGKFLVLSIAAHVLFLILAGYLVVQNIQAKRQQTFTPSAKGPNPSTRALEHKVHLKQQKNALSAPPRSKRVTTTGLSKVALPSMPLAPSLAAPLTPSSISGMGMGGLAPGGLSGGGGTGGSGGAGVNFFGGRNATQGLKGTFYDLKQTAGRQNSGVGIPEYATTVMNFGRGGVFNLGLFSRYFRAPKPLYATQIFTPSIDANLGPAAFGVEREVRPSLWVAHYKGDVIAPESGTFHFVGNGDDVLLVKFNNRLLLDACWFISTGLPAAGFYRYDFTAPDKGFTKGPAFHVEAGQAYPIEILIGEEPGGRSYAALLVEKEGAEYQKDPRGNPLLPIFRTTAAPLLPPPPGGLGYAPHAEGGPHLEDGRAQGGLLRFRPPINAPFLDAAS